MERVELNENEKPEDSKRVPKGLVPLVKSINSTLNGQPFDLAMSALFTVLGEAVRNVPDLYAKQQVILATVELAGTLNEEVAKQIDCDKCENREGCESKPDTTEH